MVIKWASDGGGGDGGAWLGGVDGYAGIELAEIFLGGVKTLGEDFDERGVGHLGLFRLILGFVGIGADEGKILRGDAVGGVAGNAAGIRHPIGGEGFCLAVVHHGFAGELAQAAIDHAGAEVFRIEKDLLAENIRMGGGTGGERGWEVGAVCEEEGGGEEKRFHVEGRWRGLAEVLAVFTWIVQRGCKAPRHRR